MTLFTQARETFTTRFSLYLTIAILSQAAVVAIEKIATTLGGYNTSSILEQIFAAPDQTLSILSHYQWFALALCLTIGIDVIVASIVVQSLLTPTLTLFPLLKQISSRLPLIFIAQLTIFGFSALGLVLLVIPAILLFIYTQFVTPFFILQKRTLRESFKESFSLVHHHFWRAATYIIGTYTAIFLAQLCWAALTSPATTIPGALFVISTTSTLCTIFGVIVIGHLGIELVAQKKAE